MINELLERAVPVCERIKASGLPVMLYGTGDGAVKISAYLKENGITPRGFVASDGFVRGQSFAGSRVLRLSEAERSLGRFCAVICFGIGEGYKELVASLRAE